jgi:hypothetical protein
MCLGAVATCMKGNSRSQAVSRDLTCGKRVNARSRKSASSGRGMDVAVSRSKFVSSENVIRKVFLFLVRHDSGNPGYYSDRHLG